MNIKALCNKQIWLYVLLIIPYFKPAPYVSGDVIDGIFNLWRVVSAGIVLYEFLKIREISKVALLLILLSILIFVSGFFNIGNFDIKQGLITTVSVISSILLFDLNFQKEFFLETLFAYGFFITIINCVCMLLFPDGMTFFHAENYTDVAFAYTFLGYDNYTFFIVFPVMVMTISFSVLKNKKITYLLWLYVGFVFFTYLIKQSFTAAICLFLMILVVVLLRKKIVNTINFKILNGGFVALFILLVLLQVQNYFLPLIGKIFGESKIWSIQYRGIVWEKALELIIKRPLLGYGIEYREVVASQFSDLDHLHNIFLEIMYQGGFVCLFIFGLVLFCVFYKLQKVRSRYSNDCSKFICNFLGVSLLILLLSMQLDYYSNCYSFYFLLIFIWKLPQFLFTKNQSALESS